MQRSCPVGGREGRSIMEGIGNDGTRLRISAVRQGLGGNPDDHLGDHHISVNRVKSVFAILLAHLSKAHAELGQCDDAWRCIGEAMTAVETTKERWYEAEINRIKGEIALKLPQLGSSQAEAYFERALTVARAQQAKSWELRAAMSMARLWHDKG